MLSQPDKQVVDYWDKNARERDVHGKLSGLAFSILAELDGSGVGLPPFIVAPMPYKDDQMYRQQRGENWYPYNNSDSVKADVAGSLHELFHEFDPRKDS